MKLPKLIASFFVNRRSERYTSIGDVSEFLDLSIFSTFIDQRVQNSLH